MKILANNRLQLLAKLTEDNMLDIVKHGTGREVYNMIKKESRIPESVLIMSAAHSDPQVQEATMLHKNATEKVLLIGLDSSDWKVQVCAASSKNATEKVLMKATTKADAIVAAIKNPKITEDILMKCAVRSEFYVRLAVAKSPKSSKKVLDACYKTTTRRGLESLGKFDEEIVEAIKKHKNWK